MPTLEKAKQFFIAQHLLIFLAIAFTWGLAWPKPGKDLRYYSFTFGGGEMGTMSSINVMIIFFISGLRLKTDDVLKSLKAPVPLIIAMVMILLVTPAVGFLPANVDMGVEEFKIGFALFCCVPTTLTSGAALIAQGAPNATVLSLMITMITNLLGTVTVPFVLKLVLSDTDVTLDAVQLLLKLVLLILIPSFAGKMLTVVFKKLSAFSKEYKVPLTIFSNANLVMVVWMSISHSQSTIVDQTAGNVFAAIGSAIALHLIFWALNYFIYFLPSSVVPHKDHSRAVFLLASQKTLPVALAIINGFDSDVGESGLIALPCIFGHLSQLVIDSFLVNRWVRKDAEEKEKNEKEGEGGVSLPLCVVVDKDAVRIPPKEEGGPEKKSQEPY
eukprot:TRINITY_DN24367_c0_g1_i1.p1 TRINITY_DN24367_c0_g1~~TRINITY_DN24367_c0_g1_i1.p1  ORF type:complete len:403 (+),score=68.37 TRINITY_DN24367_c0_g1_i1:55-1209(+)